MSEENSKKDTKWTEEQRLSALYGYDILDTPAEKNFDDIVKIAAEICGTPISLVSLVAHDRQWFKAKTGLDASQTPIEQSICARAMLQSDLFVVEDTTKDSRFNTNPLVTDNPKLRFYAGAVLETSDQIPLGMLCVLDTVPRTLTHQQGTMLKALARQVMTQLELRKVLRQMQDSESQFRQLADSIPQLAWIADETGYIFWYNQRWYDYTGTTLQEMKGWGWSKVHDTVELERLLVTWKEALESGTPFEDTFPLRRHDGAMRWHLTRALPIKNEEGKIVRWFGTNTDITEQREARESSESANMAKTDFLANMSHEIRTPMNAIIGLSNILVMSQPLTAKQRDYVKTLQTSADSLLSLINDLLDIAKIEARTVELEHIPFSISRLVQEVVSMMAVRVKEKGLTFTGDSKGLLSRVFLGDPMRMRQIVLNLCSNAIKFTDSGNVHVSITCNPSEKKGWETVCIAVKDSGIGIAPEKLNSIFHKFVQADTSISRKYGGTGLGLAITKMLAETMGGSISVESVLEEGSKFTVCVPLEVSSQQTISQPDISISKIIETVIERKVKARVLLVEDYEPNVIVAATFLEQFGYLVDVANNGTEAVAKVKTGQYVAILMDVQMHGMNGFEATQSIRQHEKQNNLPRIPIIGMTAHALAGDRNRCLASGMDEYISKPFNPVHLEEIIKNAINIDV